jgi:hypothetical protein
MLNEKPAPCTRPNRTRCQIFNEPVNAKAATTPAVRHIALWLARMIVRLGLRSATTS